MKKLAVLSVFGFAMLGASATAAMTNVKATTPKITRLRRAIFHARKPITQRKPKKPPREKVATRPVINNSEQTR